MNPTIEINLKNIKKNWLYLDGLSKKNIETGAVIKANILMTESKEEGEDDEESDEEEEEDDEQKEDISGKPIYEQVKI